ncbi:YqeG family HAD IIIA-type phosphatase [Paenibacillaceae bacterium]|nr:YqeG family HAD IIIA-type phosphatase [Paenibacillaceae bacterium]
MFTRLLPDKIVRSVYDIDLNELKQKGLKGIITDLDNTLVGAKDALATPELIAWLDGLQEQGFKVVIVSNNNAGRVTRFAEPLGLPFIYAARKPIGRPFRRALEVLGLKAEQTIVIGDQLLTDMLGGRRMGLYTILVGPVAPKDEGFTTRINRQIEKVALSRLRKKGLWPEEDTK